MKKILLSLAGLIVAASLLGIGSAIYWTQPTISDEDAVIIGRHDVAIIDLENLFNNPDNLYRIKKINPQIKILCYVNFFEIWQQPLPPDRPFGSKLRKTITTQFNEWFLVHPDGQPVIYWPGMETLNLSDLCPQKNGYSYGHYLQDILLENILNDKVWDGLFLDNLFHKISGLGFLDLDRDNREDDSRTCDYHWYLGVRDFLTGIRQAKGRKFTIIGNHLSLYYGDLVDGRFLENFPTEDYCWEEAMGIAGELPIAIFQGKWPNVNLAFNSSLLLDNAYFCLGQNVGVPDSLLLRLSNFQKLPARKRGSVVYIKADVDVYERRLGDELITVRLNRGHSVYSVTSLTAYGSSAPIKVCIDLTPNINLDNQKKFLVYELIHNHGVKLPNVVDNNLQLEPTTRFSGDIGTDGAIIWLKISWLAHYYEQIFGQPMPYDYVPGIRGDQLGWNPSQLMQREGEWFIIKI